MIESCRFRRVVHSPFATFLHDRDSPLMQISVSLVPALQPVLPAVEVAVVIDVLRATSVMATALANGAAKIITCRSIDESRQLARKLPNPLLCGERYCRRIEGFDLGNSPADYPAETVAGRPVVLTTTNGTIAIAACADVSQVVAASFLNLSAVVQQIARHDRVHLVCAGTEGEVTGEDVLLAGAIIQRLREATAVELADDAAHLAAEFWNGFCPDPARISDPARITAQALALRLRETQGGRNLIGLGYDADLPRCAAIDVLTVVPSRISRDPATFVQSAL